jgi:cytochrome c
MRLHELVATGDVAAVAAALKAGAQIDVQDHNGETALMAALRANKSAVVELLLARGANIHLTDLGGNTAHDYAWDSPELTARLEALGAKTGRAASIEHPFDRDDFEPGVLALLAMFRAGAFVVTPHDEVLALLEPEPPPDLAALIHTWAHKPRSSFAEIAGYWIESRALAHAPAVVLREVHGDTPAFGIILGNDPGGERRVVASWTTGANRARVDVVDLDGTVDALGALADLVDEGYEED